MNPPAQAEGRCQLQAFGESSVAVKTFAHSGGASREPRSKQSSSSTWSLIAFNVVCGGKPYSRDAIQHQLLVKFIENLLGCSPVGSSEITTGAKTGTNLDSFVAVLRQRAESYSSGLDGVIAELNKASPSTQSATKTATKQLEVLRERFRSLAEKYVEAVAGGDVLLTHELLGEIHELQSNVEKIVESGFQEVVEVWRDGLRKRYIENPLPGQDAKYDSLSRDIDKLLHVTLDRVQSLSYPGEPPV